MIQFASPLWLWGLTGLCIPLAIHLLSRKEGKVIPVGSLRHLTESETARFASFRLNEILLLILRCLVITLLVLLIAGTNINLFQRSSKKWLLVDRGIEKEKRLKSLIDSLSEQGYELRWLASGFPPIAEGTSGQSENYWALANAIEKNDNHDVVVISYNYLHKFKGRRIPLPSNIRWISYEPGPQTDLAKVISISGDSVWVRKLESASLLTSLRTEKNNRQTLPFAEEADIEKNDTIRVVVYGDKEFENDEKIIRAALQAVQVSIPYHMEIIRKDVTDHDETTSGWVVWLSEKRYTNPNDNFIAYRKCLGNTLPVLITGRQANLLCEETGNTTPWVLTKRLTEESALAENLPVQLASIIVKNKKTNFDRKEQRTLASASMWSRNPTPTGKSDGNNHRPLHAILATAFILALAAERWLAFQRNQ